MGRRIDTLLQEEALRQSLPRFAGLRVTMVAVG